MVPSTAYRYRRSSDCATRHAQNTELQELLTSLAAKKLTAYVSPDAKSEVPANPITTAKCTNVINVTEVKEVSPDMPLSKRALCYFQFVENYDSNRIPKSITEVECLCSLPRNFLTFREIKCEPLYYNIPVLKFDSDCNEFRETIEKVSLACVPTFKSRTTVKAHVIMGEVKDAGVDV